MKEHLLLKKKEEKKEKEKAQICFINNQLKHDMPQ